jgi:hypothetical protein
MVKSGDGEYVTMPYEENRSPRNVKMGKMLWFEKKTNNEVLKQLKLKRELLKTVHKGQITFFGCLKMHNSILYVILNGKFKLN